jgi:signal peptidase I
MAEPGNKPSTTREYVESILVTIILALFATGFVVQAFEIPSRSMEPNLLIGDHLLVNKFIYGGRGGSLDRFLPYREVRRGDIIVFKAPHDPNHPHFVKRTIGLPGDRLKIVGGQVFINGKPLSEPYARHSNPGSDPYADNFPPPADSAALYTANITEAWARTMVDYIYNDELVIPPGKYFAMGDNRDSSLDSRYWGFVDRENIMGRPILIYWSLRASESDYSQRGLGRRLINLFRVIIQFPTRTRWSRMFHFVR